jgi:tetratricopeptide (TPR) repeat protein
MAKLSVGQALLKAKSHGKKGEIEEAQKLYQTVLQAFPKNKRAQQGLAALNKPKQSATTQGPPQDTINHLINLYNQGQLVAAVEQAQALTKQYPNVFIIWNILGAAHKGLGSIFEASEAFKKVTELNPDCAEGHSNLGVTLKEQGKLDEAITSYNKALSLKPDYAEVINNMGNALKEQGKLDEAITSYNKALSLKPDYAEAYNNMGNALQDQGKLDEAITSYNKALSLKPDYAEVHRNLSTLIKYKPDNTQVALVGEMIKQSDLKDDDRCHLQYTYAKMNEDLGDLDAAYDNYSSGGKLRQKLLSYDFKQDELTFEKIKNTGPKLKEFAFSKPFDAATNTPIFILGMPRSGTTLVEQIISNHSEVHGAGELTFLSRFANSNNIYNQTINSDNILEVRKNYLNELEKVSQGKPFVTDKMPQNFLYISILLKALPEAKIIHVKRDPAATCWSNFKHYFSSKGMGYSYDLKDTVGFFKLYQDLMDFWDQQYSDQIYHLDYDKLTVEQEPETRKLIEYLELGWEDDCLSPHKNKRSVRTASQQQVREKVFTGSSQVWRKFEPYLNGAFDEFEYSSAPPLK